MPTPNIPTEVPGFRLIDGGDINAIAAVVAAMIGANGSSNPTFPFYVSTQDQLTANAGGGQANALPLTASLCRVTTVATAGDSVQLPISKAGLEITVVNASANAMQVFPALTSTTINGIAGTTGVSQPAGKTATYYCASPGAWHSQVGS